MKVKSQQDFFSGLLFMAVGVAFAWGSTNYQVGDSARMGPGYFPLLLGVLLALLGAAVSFKALAIETPGGEKVGRIAWKPLVFIIAANLVFGVALGGLPRLKVPALGLIVGIYALIFIACLAGERFKAKEALVLATVLAVLSYLAFVLLLKLQFVVWPALTGGS